MSGLRLASRLLARSANVQYNMAVQEKNQGFLAKARLIENVPWCEEYERMISGMPFRPWLSLELERSSLAAKRFCHRYNQSWISEDASLEDLHRQRTINLKTILGEVGANPNIEPPLHLSYGCNTSIGKKLYANSNLMIFDSAFVTIGDRVLIGPNVTLTTDAHETGVESRRQGILFARPISIGDDCWIGAGVTVLAGVEIGKGCTIGAGAVVNKHIPEYSLAAGIPAKVIKKLEDPDSTLKETKRGGEGAGA